MKIILIKDVPKLGKRFDVKDVSSGHALNLLIPRGMAISATPEALKNLELQKAKHDAERKVTGDLLIKNVKDLENVTLNISGKANDKGHLFAGLHREAIVAELEKQTRLQISPELIVLEHPLKEVGDHEVEVKLPNQAGVGKSVKFKIVITAA
jgi:large subunit ribosomal protein L9